MQDVEDFPNCERCGGGLVELCAGIWKCVKCNRCATYGFVNESSVVKTLGEALKVC